MKSRCSLVAARRAGSGFTLIELLVVVTIVGVLLAVGVPGMSDLIRDARLSAQSDLLVSSLNAARLEAVKQRVNYTVCMVTTAPSSATACAATPTADWSSGWIATDGTTIVQRIEPKSGLTVMSTSVANVVFSATLGSASAAKSFTLCVKGRKEQLVDVTLSGHVSKRLGTNVCS